MELLVIFWVVCGIGAGFVASSRGANGCAWLTIGFLLGPIGVLMAFAAKSPYACPYCKSAVEKGATRCPKCQSTLGEAEPPAQKMRTTYRCRGCKTEIDPSMPECPGCHSLIDWRGLAQDDTGAPPPASKKCPDCAEEVKAEARKCRFCGYVFE